MTVECQSLWIYKRLRFDQVHLKICRPNGGVFTFSLGLRFMLSISGSLIKLHMWIWNNMCSPKKYNRSANQSPVSYLSRRNDSDWHFCYRWYEQYCQGAENPHILSCWLAPQRGEYSKPLSKQLVACISPGLKSKLG